MRALKAMDDDENNPAPSTTASDASSASSTATMASQPALTPKSRKKGLRLKSQPSPASTPPPPAGLKSPIDSVTPSFTRNIYKLISANRRHQREVVSLRTSVEKLQEENLELDKEAHALRTRLSSLELERIDLRSINRENERARRRAEARLSTISARSASLERRHSRSPDIRHPFSPLNARVADGVDDRHRGIDRQSFEALPCSGASGPSAQALASPSKVHTKRAGFSLPTRAGTSPYRVPAAAPTPSDSTHTSPRSEFNTDLPALSPHTSSPSSINTPLPTPSTSDFIHPLDKSTSSGSTRKRLSALFGIPSAKKARPSLDMRPDRENDGLVRNGSTRSAKVMMVSSISPDTSAFAAAYAKDASPGESSYGAPRGPSPYSAMSHSTASSQRKVTPKSTVSKATASSQPARVAFAGETSGSSGGGRRHISRPMDASNSSSSSHQSHTHAQPRMSMDTTGGRTSIETVQPRRSHISSRGRLSHGTFAFEKPAVAPPPHARSPPPFGSGLTPPQAQPLRAGLQMHVEEASRDAQFGSTRSRGRVSLDERRTRLDSDEKGLGLGLMRAASVGHSVRSGKSTDEKRRGGSLREKDRPKEKTSCSSLGRLWLQKTKEVLCAARPASQASTIIIPPPGAVDPSSAPSSAPPNMTSHSQARTRRNAPLPARAQLPMFAFEPASRAGVRSVTPDSGRSRGTASSRGEREVAFKVPEVPERARERARIRRAAVGGSNTYTTFCEDLRRAISDDGFVVFEKYVQQYETGAFPLSGPRGLVERLKKLLDLSAAGEERKRNLVDRFVAIARDSEAR